VTERVFFQEIETRFGWSIFSWNDTGLFSFILPQRTQEEARARFEKQCRAWGKHLERKTANPFGIEEDLGAYFAGREVHFSFYPFSLEGYTPFTRQVLEYIASLPYGVLTNYGAIARAIGHPHSFRAVGRALGRNRLPLLIPCHRVIARESLGGYGEGLRYKVLLLSLELHSARA